MKKRKTKGKSTRSNKATITKRVLFQSYSHLFDSNSSDYITEVARFRLIGDKVETTWHADWFRRDIEDNGIVAFDRVVFPKDGRVFIDNLEQAYGNATLMSVEDISGAEDIPRLVSIEDIATPSDKASDATDTSQTPDPPEENQS